MKIELETGKLLGFRLYSGDIGGKIGGKDGRKDDERLAGMMGGKTQEQVGVKGGDTIS